MPITDSPVRAILGAVVAHPKAVLIVFLLCTGALGWQARKFEIDASADTLLMRDDPNYVLSRVLNRRFSPQEFLLVAYRPLDRPLFSPQTFRDIRELRE
jgi:predicted RND superfamily exporter protein